MKFQKRHIVLAALVLALSAAVFINWQFSDTDSSLTKKVSKELGAATYVNSDISTDDQLAQVSKHTTKADEYFAKAEVDRQQAYDTAVETAKETLKLADSSEEAKSLAVEQINKLEDNLVIQNNIEGIIKGKGFSACHCLISEDSCTIAILKEELVEDAPLIIKDVVLSQMDIDFNAITIIEI